MVFNLSEKIGNMVNETGTIHQAITTINVKEFIRLLKIEFTCGCLTCPMKACKIKREKIDKLAGAELNGI